LNPFDIADNIIAMPMATNMLMLASFFLPAKFDMP
jgi:hypothetical protein